MFGLFGRNEKPQFPFATATVTDRGFVRRANEDAFLDRPEDGFFCVSDGMGGGDGGALASRWICDAFADVMDAERGSAYEIKQFALVREIQRVNDRIRAFAKENGYRMMGATLALMLVDHANPTRALVCHAGDSRIYRVRAGALKQLTRDHTVGNELGRALSENAAARAADLQSRRNPLTHILTRAVGTGFKVVVVAENDTDDNYDNCRNDGDDGLLVLLEEGFGLRDLLLLYRSGLWIHFCHYFICFIVVRA